MSATLEELTNKQQAIKDAADLALTQVQRASIRLSEAEGFLKVQGVGCARSLILQAIERLNVAMYHLPTL